MSSFQSFSLAAAIIVLTVAVFSFFNQCAQLNQVKDLERQRQLATQAEICLRSGGIPDNGFSSANTIRCQYSRYSR